MGRDADRLVRALLRGRRPRRFAATIADAAEIRVAIELIGARPYGAGPRGEFADDLRRRVAARMPYSGERARRRAAVGRRSVLRGALRAGSVAASAFAAGFALDRCLGPRTADRTADSSDGSGDATTESVNHPPPPACWRTAPAAPDDRPR